MDAPLELDSPMSLLHPLTDSLSTPDSLDAPDLLWPYDLAPDPNELHDFIVSADDDGGAAFAFDGDSDQPFALPGITPLLPLDEQAAAAAAAAAAVESVAPTVDTDGTYAPVLSSLKSKRAVCQSACVHCRRAKTKCDGHRPCARCTTHGRASECMDRPVEEIERGKQNRKRKPKRVNNGSASLTAHSTTTPATTQPALDAPPSPSPVNHFLPLDSNAARLSFRSVGHPSPIHRRPRQPNVR